MVSVKIHLDKIKFSEVKKIFTISFHDNFQVKRFCIMKSHDPKQPEAEFSIAVVAFGIAKLHHNRREYL